MSDGNAELLGGIEAGGTKFVCAVGTRPDALRAVTRFATSDDADATLAQAVEFFRQQKEALGPVAAVGIGSFGPLDLDPSSPSWGHVTTTPKPGWRGFDVAGTVGRALGVPVGFDTDVAAAALAEHRWGAAQDVSDVVYVTVGTGIGGGVLVGGEPVHGMVHPEMGHMLVPRHPDDVDFAGCCPFHGGACLEGLASGPAIAARWSTPAESLPPDHPAWDVEAYYLGTFAANLVLTLSPERIVIGGGVSKAPGLAAKVRARLVDALAGYVSTPQIEDSVDEYLVAPALGDDAGVAGALVLAARCLSREGVRS